MPTNTLTPGLLYNMDACWRAANYLSVGQIYLYDTLEAAADAWRCEAHAVGALGHDSRP